MAATEAPGAALSNHLLFIQIRDRSSSSSRMVMGHVINVIDRKDCMKRNQYLCRRLSLKNVKSFFWKRYTVRN